MYACYRGTGCGFFGGVRALATPALESSDPPPPRNTKEPEPHRQGSGPKWITRYAIADGDLVWGRGKPPLAHCPSTARKLPTHFSTYVQKVRHNGRVHTSSYKGGGAMFARVSHYTVHP